ncbi:hypothetical protein Fcan01_15491 [Folsomia candida]|uniref:Uncharacterized protein n=1 Tax=Folsomia candida TaxID=158441 RepID=A0A226DVF0_FOLCA|nr:hypothetical protein Fcan01_15491 [Folsomia candida]
MIDFANVFMYEVRFNPNRPVRFGSQRLGTGTEPVIKVSVRFGSPYKPEPNRAIGSGSAFVRKIYGGFCISDNFHVADCYEPCGSSGMRDWPGVALGLEGILCSPTQQPVCDETGPYETSCCKCLESKNRLRSNPSPLCHTSLTQDHYLHPPATEAPPLTRERF